MKSIKIKTENEKQFIALQKTLFKKGFRFIKTGQELKEYDPEIIGIHAFWSNLDSEKFTRLMVFTKCPRIWRYYDQSGFLMKDEKALAAIRQLRKKTYRA